MRSSLTDGTAKERGRSGVQKGMHPGPSRSFLDGLARMYLAGN